MIATIARPNRPSLLGVLYAEDFDDEGAVPGLHATDPVPEPEAIEPVFSATEIEAARMEARQAGRVDAEHGLAGSRNHLLGLIAAGMAEARAGAHAAAEAAAEAVAGSMLSALAVCLPRFCEQHGAAELRALAASLLPALADEPTIVVRINPAMVAAMHAELATLDPDIARRVQVTPVEAMVPGDARVSWTDGSAVRDTSRVRAAFEDGLAALGLLDREHAYA